MKLIKHVFNVTILCKGAIVHIHTPPLINKFVLSNEKDIKVHSIQLREVILPFALKFNFDNLNLSGLCNDKEI